MNHSFRNRTSPPGHRNCKNPLCLVCLQAESLVITPPFSRSVEDESEIYIPRKSVASVPVERQEESVAC